MQPDPIRDSAQRFFGQHLGEHLASHRQQLVDRCARYLLDTYRVSRARAEEVALQTLGEVEARGCPAYIDLARSTSYTAFVVDPTTRQTLVLTAADLLTMARHHTGLRRTA